MSKSLVKNSIANVFYRSLNVFFPLITATYVSRVLLVNGVGKVSYAQNIVSYFVMFAALGMPTYGTREIAKLKNQCKNKLFSELFLINAISTAFFSGAYIILINSIDGFQKNLPLYYAVGIQLFMNVFNIDWYYQGEEEYSYIAVRSFVIKVLSVMSIFLFVKEANDYIYYAIITALGIVGNYIFNIMHLRGRVKFTIKELNLKKHIKPLMLLLSSSVAIELYTAVDTTMIGAFCTDTEVGFYAYAIKIIKLVEAMISALGAILLPRLSYYYAEGKNEDFNRLVHKAEQVLLFIAVPGAVGIFLVADDLVPILFGASFYGTINTLRILAFTLPILVINVLFGIQVLIPAGNEKKYLITVCCGAAVNIVLNPIFILLYKNDGAAFASLISELTVAISTLLYARRIVNIKPERDYVVTLLISTVFMIIGVCSINSLLQAGIIRLLIKVLLGVGIFSGVAILLRNCVAYEFLGIIQRRLKR